MQITEDFQKNLNSIKIKEVKYIISFVKYTLIQRNLFV